MAMSPCTLLAKLDELKRWQEMQHERLLKQHNSRLEETDRGCKTAVSDYNTIQGLSAFDSSHTDSLVEDTRKCVATGENDARIVVKKPFLKRGEGLGKFGMKPGDQRRPFNKMRPPETSVHKRLAELRKAEKKRVDSFNQHDKADTNKSSEVEILCKDNQLPPRNSITPLKKPDGGIQPKGTWIAVDDTIPENTKTIVRPNDEASTSMVEEMQEISPIKVQDNNSNDLLACLKILATEKFGSNVENDSNTNVLAEIDEIASGAIQPPDINKQLLEYLQNLLQSTDQQLTRDSSLNSSQCGETTAYEQALARELDIFEQLEQRVNNSSFCSTNSSILELLSSTPHKLFLAKLPAVVEQEQKAVHFTKPVAKRELEFHEPSDESSVNSDDFENPTITAQENWTDRESTSSSASLQSVREVIVRQNACVMTDERGSPDEALKKRLRDLDTEISNFRQENTKLQKMKGDVENERRDLQKSMKKMERELQDERIKMEYDVGEEKKKLAKERMVFERYAKDIQNKPSRKEREEISNLKAELANVKETLKLKDTRNGTTQARLRNQIKTLEKENANLKDEVEKLQKQNGKLVAAQKVAKKPSDTKMLHEINKNLTKLAQDARINKQVENDETEMKRRKGRCKSDMYETEYRRSFSGNRDRKSFNEEDSCSSSDDDPISETYTNNQFVRNYEEMLPKTRLREEFSRRSKGDDERFSKSADERSLKNADERSLRNADERSLRNADERSLKNADERFLRNTDERSLRNAGERYSRTEDERPSKSTEKENDKNVANFDVTTFRNFDDVSVEQNYEKLFGRGNARSRNNSMNDTQATASGKVETILEDGSKEIKYPNGNVKHVSADGNYIILNYYNGDIKETKLLEGTIKYFYAETEMWQTTLPNGDEMFEFSDGQVERRFANGDIEVTFPSGVVKKTDGHGIEELSYPDGSVVTIKGEEKVLLLPNGQKEIHTKEHKRREYPDGTVKILYPDGLQETRYSNGRIRMKDKDGHLLMDTHSNDL